MCILSVHPLTNSILGQEKELRRDEDKILEFKSLSDINPYLRLSVSEIGDRDKEVIKNSITLKAKQLLQYCIEPKSRELIFDKIGLYNNTKNFRNHLKPLIDAGWLQLTLADTPTSRDQQYLSTKLGKQLLSFLEDSKIERTPVVSSNIASVGYDKEKKLLEIEFHHGAVYQYFDVPERVYDELMSSPSQGAYFMNEIKSKFNYQKK